MSKEKFTVKELNIEFEKLAERITHLERGKNKDFFREKENTIKTFENMLKPYDERIYFLESLLDKSKSNHTNSDINDIEFRCRFCEEKLNNKASLKKHIQDNHQAFFKCKSCQEVFNESWKTEVHMKTHDTVNSYKCDICDKELVMNWRLKKHKTSHNGSSKYCHFFNNNKIVPLKK